MSLFGSTDDIMVIVEGGPGNFIGLIMGSWIAGHRFVTKKIELPAKWEDLVAKYKNVVPNYV